MRSKSFIFQLALVGFILTSSECFGLEKKIFPTPTQSAIADTSTTIIGLNAGAVEMNPMGLYVSTILKIGIIFIVNERLEGDEKYLLEKTESTIWTGAAIIIYLLFYKSPLLPLLQQEL